MNINFKNLSVQKTKDNIFSAIYLLTLIFLFIGAINSSAQVTDTTVTQPFHLQAQQRIDNLVRVQKINVSVKSIAFETGLTQKQVGDILFGQAEIVDSFCDAIICDYEIYYLNGKRVVNLLPKEEDRIYSKMTGEIIFTKL